VHGRQPGCRRPLSQQPGLDDFGGTNEVQAGIIAKTVLHL
jgi:hypothetical protein